MHIYSRDKYPSIIAFPAPNLPPLASFGAEQKNYKYSSGLRTLALTYLQ